MNPFGIVHAFSVVGPLVMHFVPRSTQYEVEMAGRMFRGHSIVSTSAFKAGLKRN